VVTTQLQLAGAPPEASISVTLYGFTSKVMVAADWEERA
jgi:hypothetical protein